MKTKLLLLMLAVVGVGWGAENINNWRAYQKVCLTTANGTNTNSIKFKRQASMKFDYSDIRITKNASTAFLPCMVVDTALDSATVWFTTTDTLANGDTVRIWFKNANAKKVNQQSFNVGLLAENYSRNKLGSFVRFNSYDNVIYNTGTNYAAWPSNSVNLDKTKGQIFYRVADADVHTYHASGRIERKEYTITGDSTCTVGDAVIVADSTGLDERNHTGCYYRKVDGSEGSIVFYMGMKSTSGDGVMFYKRSTNAVHTTWEAARRLTNVRQDTATESAWGRSLQLPDGKIALSICRIDTGAIAWNDVRFIYSSDYGETFNDVLVYHNTSPGTHLYTEMSLIYFLTNGTYTGKLEIMSRDDGGGTFARFQSTDSGQTWSKLADYSFASVSVSGVPIDWARFDDNTIAVMYGFSTSQKTYISKDEGATWIDGAKMVCPGGAKTYNSVASLGYYTSVAWSTNANPPDGSGSKIYLTFHNPYTQALRLYNYTSAGERPSVNINGANLKAGSAADGSGMPLSINGKTRPYTFDMRVKGTAPNVAMYNGTTWIGTDNNNRWYRISTAGDNYSDGVAYFTNGVFQKITIEANGNNFVKMYRDDTLKLTKVPTDGSGMPNAALYPSLYFPGNAGIVDYILLRDYTATPTVSVLGSPANLVSITTLSPTSAKRGALVTVRLTGAGNTQGTGSISKNSTTITPISWSDTLITFNASGSSGFLKVTNSDAQSDSIQLQIDNSTGVVNKLVNSLSNFIGIGLTDR